MARQGGDRGRRLRETVGAPCSNVVVRLPRGVDGEAPVQHRAAGHVAHAPVKPVGVPEIRQDLVVCGGDTGT